MEIIVLRRLDVTLRGKNQGQDLSELQQNLQLQSQAQLLQRTIAVHYVSASRKNGNITAR
jgi:hypothetical protein